MRLSVGEIVEAAGGRLVLGDPNRTVSAFSIDSRTLDPGACFIALTAVRDGHDFVHDAFRRGAVAAIVARVPDARDLGGGALVLVDDPLAALAALGRAARQRLSETTVVGVTGSAGKTSTKDLTAGALGRARRVHASPGSYNNEAGLPLTLLGAGLDVDVIVAEMGARFAGNIADLCAIAGPEIGVVTHVGLAHAELLGGPAGIARVKGELVEALPSSGTAVLNADDDATPGLAERTEARVVTVGAGPDAEVRVGRVSLDGELRPRFGLDTAWGRLDVQLQVRGAHQAQNAGMAAAVALSLGVEPDAVVAGLADVRGSSLRMHLERSPAGVSVLDDSYNASPSSLRAGLDALGGIEPRGRRVAVLGPMLELGAHGAEAHRDLGRHAIEQGVDLLIAVGGDAAHLVEGACDAIDAGVGHPDARALVVDDALEAQRLVLELVAPGDAVLVKASRAAGLERIAAALRGSEVHA